MGGFQIHCRRLKLQQNQHDKFNVKFQNFPKYFLV